MTATTTIAVAPGDADDHLGRPRRASPTARRCPPTQLDATASVPGTFAYSPAAGTVLRAGSQTLSVTFTPTDSTDYKTVTATTTIDVAQARRRSPGPTPAGITYGTALSSTQLDATRQRAGDLRLLAGRRHRPEGGASQTLSVTFTPTDTTDYTTATATTTIAWRRPRRRSPGPTPRASPTARRCPRRSSTPRPACRGPSPTRRPPAPSWRRASEPLVGRPSRPPTPTDYTTVTATTTIVVAQATPTITWAGPAGITYGTALSSRAARRDVQRGGDLHLLAGAGTVPKAGSDALSVTFTPTDTTDYTTATATATHRGRRRLRRSPGPPPRASPTARRCPRRSSMRRRAWRDLHLHPAPARCRRRATMRCR